MTLEQRKDLEGMLNYYEWKRLLADEKSNTESAFIHEDRIRQIQEVLEVLGYEVNKEEKELLSNGRPYKVYTITGIVG